jgi:hypothetical protein
MFLSLFFAISPAAECARNRKHSTFLLLCDLFDLHHSVFFHSNVVNMAAPLIICTKVEQRVVIRFLWAEGVCGAEIDRNSSAHYSDSVLSVRVDLRPDRSSSVTHIRPFLYTLFHSYPIRYGKILLQFYVRI